MLVFATGYDVITFFLDLISDVPYANCNTNYYLHIFLYIIYLRIFLIKTMRYTY